MSLFVCTTESWYCMFRTMHTHLFFFLQIKHFYFSKNLHVLLWINSLNLIEYWKQQFVLLNVMFWQLLNLTSLSEKSLGFWKPVVKCWNRGLHKWFERTFNINNTSILGIPFPTTVFVLFLLLIFFQQMCARPFRYKQELASYPMKLP